VPTFPFRPSRAITLLTLVLTAAALVDAQQPTFQSERRLVPVYATVKDADNRFVTDLTSGDFELLDEGRPQPLALFRNDFQPIATVVMLDTSFGMSSSLDTIRNAAEQFVLRLLPGDVGRVCAFNSRIQFTSGFTGDRDLLAKSLQKIDYGNASRLYDAVAAALDSFGGVNERRVILLFTHGLDNASRVKLGTIIDRARANDAMVYAVGLKAREWLEDDGARRWNDGPVEMPPDRILKKLAQETGGGYFELAPSANPGPIFTRVGEELHRQYLLAFAPASADGRVHKLTVRVPHRHVDVRARRSYLSVALGSP
jgi:VWFA-related protein